MDLEEQRCCAGPAKWLTCTRIHACQVPDAFSQLILSSLLSTIPLKLLKMNCPQTVVAINQFASDTQAELETVKQAALEAGGCGCQMIGPGVQGALPFALCKNGLDIV
eukprot:454954-Pelagomonas_calceolata.AAC.3